MATTAANSLFELFPETYFFQSIATVTFIDSFDKRDLGGVEYQG